MNKLNRLVRNDIRARLAFARYGYVPKRYNDSRSTRRLTRQQKMRVRRLADHAIRIHDRRYNDIIGLIAFKAILVKSILPVLIPLLKAAAVSGVGGAIAGGLKEKIVNPLLGRIINRAKQLNAEKGDGTYTQALIKGIKEDMGRLIAVLKKEGAFVSSKIQGLFNKIRGVA